MTMTHPGSKPIVKSPKLHHVKRTIVERQELRPRDVTPKHVKWKTQAGGIAVAAAIAAGASAQAAPSPRDAGGSSGLDLGPTPAAEVLVAEAEPIAETLIHMGPPIEMAGFDKVDGVKDNPYPTAKPRARLVRKARGAAPAFEHVDDLKANPYGS
ncbi:MAG: hypothetical protein IT385_03230 [Deltaproteobacteria bacterium]|nr:hypothetical protein [Deltaproteobacteria bacterium]